MQEVLKNETLINIHISSHHAHGLIAPKLILQLVSWKNILVLKVIEMHYAHLSIEALSVTLCKFMHGRLHADACTVYQISK